MITLILPRGFDISRAAKKLCEEAGTSANIKKTANRQSVQQAIASAQAKLKLFKQTPPNGLALFVGNETPPSALRRRRARLTPTAMPTATPAMPMTPALRAAAAVEVAAAAAAAEVS